MNVPPELFAVCVNEIFPDVAEALAVKRTVCALKFPPSLHLLKVSDAGLAVISEGVLMVKVKLSDVESKLHCGSGSPPPLFGWTQN